MKLTQPEAYALTVAIRSFQPTSKLLPNPDRANPEATHEWLESIGAFAPQNTRSVENAMESALAWFVGSGQFGSDSLNGGFRNLRAAWIKIVKKMSPQAFDQIPMTERAGVHLHPPTKALLAPWVLTKKELAERDQPRGRGGQPGNKNAQKKEWKLDGQFLLKLPQAMREAGDKAAKKTDDRHLSQMLRRILAEELDRLGVEW